MFDWLRRKDNTVSRIELNNLFEYFKYGIYGKSSVSEVSAIEVTAVLCAVRVIAEGVAQMPMSIRKKEYRGNREYSPPQRDHWAWKLLVERPNDWMTPYEFREYAIFIAALYGDFVALKNGPRRGNRITELLPLVPGSWSVKQGSDYKIKYVVKIGKGVEQTYDSKDVLHMRGPSLDGLSGLKPVLMARDAVALADSLEDHQLNLSKNGGRPSGVLSSDSKISPEKAKQIKDAWSKKFGSDGSGGVAVLDGGWKFSAMQMSSVDAQHLETRKHQIEEIARAFRVFPQMLMQSDKASTFASAEQFFRAHVIHTLGPWVERFENALKRDILAGEEGFFADLDERNLMRGDFRDQSEYYAKALGSGGTPGWMTQNDIRLEIGLEPVDDPQADRLFNGFQDQPNGQSDDQDDEDTQEDENDQDGEADDGA